MVSLGHNGTPYGKRLLPTLIDDAARQNPNKECIQIPRSSQPSDGWKIVTWKSMANAINRCAHNIVAQCGPAEKDTFPTIAFLGPNDARYIVIMLAAVKAGYQVLFISPRNSQEGQMNLFGQTNCNLIALPHTHRAAAQPWLDARPEMQPIDLDDIEVWFDDEPVPHFPYTKTFAEGEFDPLVVLHTSGSTGLPKPIVCRQGLFAINDAWHDLPEWQGSVIAVREWATCSRRQFVPMPLFHMAAVCCVIMNAFYWDAPVALGPADRPLTGELVVECLRNVDVESALLAPALLEDISQTEEMIGELTKLKLVVFGGGNLARDAGNRLVAKGLRLLNIIGATEFAPFPLYAQRDPMMWQYFCFNPEVFGCEFRKQSEDEDVYELVVVRQNPKHPGFQGFFYTFPDLQEYSTKDLYRPHPTVPNNWIYHGRSDNIIVFSNGEKLNPVTMEEIISDPPQVKGAVVVGSERFQAGLLIEPTVPCKTREEEKELLDSVWPFVEKANHETVTHGRIGRNFMAVSNPDKPFLRAGKGTIQRALTIKLYEEEIAQLYERAGAEPNGKAPDLDVSSDEALVASIVSVFRKSIGAEGLEADMDFFTAGIDSMGVMNASRLLRGGLEQAGFETDADALATRVIYGNPTPQKLAGHIMSVIVRGQKGAQLSEDEQQQQAMKAIHEKYTQNLIVAKPGRPDPSNENQTIILTGSTGMLGSYFLDLMARNPSVSKIICLNRAQDGGRAQQAKAMAERGLDTTCLDNGKAEFYHADMSKHDFGLGSALYTRLQSETDRVIHNAWPVNFNIPIESFEPHLAGVRNIADLAATSTKRIAVIFIASIAVADRWNSADGTKVPETRLENYALAAGGYGRSKMVGSLIIEDASRPGTAGDFPAAVVRVGQVAGPEAEAGMWNRQEWLPSIIASSLYLGALPAHLGAMNRVDWTPAERIATLVLEVGGVAQKRGAGEISGYYHGVNPHESSWSDLAVAVQEFYGKERIPELVGFPEWIERLERSQADEASAGDVNRGVKLLDFYRSTLVSKAVVYDMQRTTEASPTVRSTVAITPEMMKRWCKQWGNQ